MDIPRLKGASLIMKASSMVKTLSLLVAVLMAAMAAGCQYILPKEEEPLAPPLVVPKDVVYTTIDVERGDIVNSVQGMARFESVRMVDVFFSAGGGRVKSVNAKYGDTVKKGDVLLELDTGDLDYELQVAKLRYQQQVNNYNVLKKRTRDKTTLKNAQIDLDVAKLGIKQLEQKKADAKLVAPIDGNIVYVTTANLGSNVDAYSTLVRIADPSVTMLQYENDNNRSSFQIGMKVQVTMKSDDSTCEGEVVSTPFEREKFDAEDLANMLFIKVPDEFVKNTKVGDEAKVVVILAERKGVLKLPRNVVKTYMQRRYVQVLVDNVKVEKDVQVGLETATECEILSGLEEGDKVIVR
jgi:macrolide-specific efflux system membrane fusion protein